MEPLLKKTHCDLRIMRFIFPLNKSIRGYLTSEK